MCLFLKKMYSWIRLFWRFITPQLAYKQNTSWCYRVETESTGVKLCNMSWPVSSPDILVKQCDTETVSLLFSTHRGGCVWCRFVPVRCEGWRLWHFLAEQKTTMDYRVAINIQTHNPKWPASPRFLKVVDFTTLITDTAKTTVSPASTPASTE